MKGEEENSREKEQKTQKGRRGIAAKERKKSAGREPPVFRFSGRTQAKGNAAGLYGTHQIGLPDIASPEFQTTGRSLAPLQVSLLFFRSLRFLRLFAAIPLCAVTSLLWVAAGFPWSLTTWHWIGTSFPCGRGRIGNRESVLFPPPVEIVPTISTGFILHSRNCHAPRRTWRFRTRKNRIR